MSSQKSHWKRSDEALILASSAKREFKPSKTNTYYEFNSLEREIRRYWAMYKAEKAPFWQRIYKIAILNFFLILICPDCHGLQNAQYIFQAFLNSLIWPLKTFRVSVLASQCINYVSEYWLVIGWDHSWGYVSLCMFVHRDSSVRLCIEIGIHSVHSDGPVRWGI
jgi:hypothetical protein